MIRKSRGFTLIEVMIAMAICLQSVMNSKVKTESALERLQQLQMTMLTLSSDMQGGDCLASPPRMPACWWISPAVAGVIRPTRHAAPYSALPTE